MANAAASQKIKFCTHISKGYFVESVTSHFMLTLITSWTLICCRVCYAKCYRIIKQYGTRICEWTWYKRMCIGASNRTLLHIVLVQWMVYTNFRNRRSSKWMLVTFTSKLKWPDSLIIRHSVNKLFFLLFSF